MKKITKEKREYRKTTKLKKFNIFYLGTNIIIYLGTNLKSINMKQQKNVREDFRFDFIKKILNFIISKSEKKHFLVMKNLLKFYKEQENVFLLSLYSAYIYTQKGME